MADLPSGIVTFLYSDIEGSTRMWEQHPDAMQVSLERHNQILQDCIAHHGGIVYKIIGDEFQSAFAIPSQALEAAISIQTALSEEKWGESTCSNSWMRTLLE